MLGRIYSTKNVTKVSTAGTQYNSVSFNRMALTSQCNICDKWKAWSYRLDWFLVTGKVFIFPQGPKSFCILFLVLIPLEAEIFILHRLRAHHVVAFRQDDTWRKPWLFYSLWKLIQPNTFCLKNVLRNILSTHLITEISHFLIQISNFAQIITTENAVDRFTWPQYCNTNLAATMNELVV